MKCDNGRLMAYRDDALPPKEREVLEEHLANCAACRQRLALLQRREMDVAQQLECLEPQPGETTDAAQALVHFRTLAQPAHPSLWTTMRWRIEMAKQRMMAGRWRPAAIGLTALVLVAVLFSFAPVRDAAADFLGVFRVRKFAVIPVDLAQLEQLEDLEGMLEGVLGEPTFLREPGDPQAVADAGEASALAGFHVRVPSALPEGATRREFTVQEGPAARLEIERDTMQALLDVLGLEDVTLPPVDTMTMEADIPAMVLQEYRLLGNGRISVHQSLSPTATLPSGVDPALLGEVMLRLLGIPAEDAQRLAQTIDWTSTLVIPLPTDVVRSREVEVDGVTGLWLEERSERYPPDVTILWQRDGVVYMVNGSNVDRTLLLRIADSLS